MKRWGSYKTAREETHIDENKWYYPTTMTSINTNISNEFFFFVQNKKAEQLLQKKWGGDVIEMYVWVWLFLIQTWVP